MKSIITEIPLAFSLLCLLLGAIYSMTLYYREYRHEFPAIHRAWMAGVRFILVSVIAFFLLSPLVRSISREVDDPILIIAQDDSRSLISGSDSSYYVTQYPGQLRDFSNALGEKFTVHRYSFGSEVSRIEKNAPPEEVFGFDDERTDISRLFGNLGDIYENRNVGALVLASDGIYNSGMNPLYGMGNIRFPVYTIGLGDTTIKKDLLVADIRYNRMAYLDNSFPVEVTVLGNKADGEKARVGVYHRGSRVAYRDISFKGEAFSEKVLFTLEASEPGLRQYEIRLDELEGEVNLSNNKKSIYIDVLDSRNRILIIAAAPHPDITAMKEALRSNINYEVENVFADDPDINPEAYNLVILHQLPSVNNIAVGLTDQLEEKGIPALYILGQQSNLARWNSLKLGVEIRADRKSIHEVLPDLNSNFSLFTVPEEMTRMIGSLPPLNVPFGNYQTVNSITPFIDQRIGNISTSRPLVCFGRDLGRRWGIITGTGIWRWRLMNYSNSGTHEGFNDLMIKMAQYLSLRENKNQFRVYHNRNFYDNEQVVFEAEVYNDSYELITEPEVEITLINSEDERFPFNFMKMNDSYYLEAGVFPPGKYDYAANVTVGDTVFRESGSFTVTELNIESLKTTADHNLLYNIASQTGGRFYTPDQLEELETELTEKPEIRPVVFSHLRYLPLMDFPWILAALIALLTVEWFARRRLGSY